MEPFVAYFDDSGQADPERDTYYNLGMVVLPFMALKDVGDQWWMMIRKTLDLPAAPPQLGIEAKWTELREYARRVESGKGLSGEKRFAGFIEAGVTAESARSLIDRCVDFIANCDVLTLVGVSVNKPVNWSQYQSSDYAKYMYLTACKGSPKSIATVRSALRKNVREKAFEWGILQRLQYFLEDKENSPCILIGDEGDAQQEWYSSHSKVHSGLGRYTDSRNVVGNVVFGSSIHNPGLQIADWVALAIRQWTDGRPELLSRILHRFRGFPDNVPGRGLLMIPQAKDFPNLPLAQAYTGTTKKPR